MTVRVTQGGREVAAKQMKKALPAEMIQLVLKAEKITGTEDLEVTVS